MKLRACVHSTRANLTLAEYLEEEERYDEAQPLYDTNVALAKAAVDELFHDGVEVAKALNNAGLCHKRRGHFAEALALYREGVSVCEDRVTRMVSDPRQLSIIHKCLTDNMAVVRDLLSQHVQPAGGANYAGGGEAEAAMTSATGAEGFRRCKEEGNRCFREGNVNQAIRWYSAAIRAATTAAECDRGGSVEGGAEESVDAEEVAKVHANRAACAIELGDYIGGEQDASRAIELSPQYAKAHYRLGVALSSNAKSGVSTEKYERATAALEEALRLDPSFDIATRKLAEVREFNKSVERHKNATTSPHSINMNMSVMGWVHSPLGKLDALIGSRGEAAVIGADGGSSYLAALAASYQAWHDGLKASMHCLQIGAQIKRNPSVAYSLQGGRNFDELAALRLLSRAIWATDRAEITCAISHMHIDGRLYTHEQLLNATQGLMSLCERPLDHQPRGVDGQTRAVYLGNLKPDEMDAIVEDLDLRDEVVRERLEGTIRQRSIYVHVSTFLICAGNLEQGELTKHLEGLMDHICKANLWRRLAIRRATVQLLEPRRADELTVGSNADPFDFPIPSSEEREASLAALRGIGGGDLAEVLNSSGTARISWHLARKLLRQIGLDEYTKIVQRACDEWPEDQLAWNLQGWCLYERASFNRPGGSYLEAHKCYARAAALAQEQDGGDAVAPNLWEAANALGRAGGDTGLGTPVGILRKYCAEAERFDATLVRGIYAHVHGGANHPSQAEVAVRSVVHAMAKQLPEVLVTKGEYKKLTEDEFQLAAVRPKPKVEIGPDGSPCGPMWIAGKPLPFVS